MVLDHIADSGDLKTRILKFMLQARYSICDKILYKEKEIASRKGGSHQAAPVPTPCSVRFKNATQLHHASDAAPVPARTVAKSRTNAWPSSG